MGLAGINLLNIGLMLLSLAVAMVLPFETFLFAYAVLGPLHYLTQISWLHDRQCFTLNARDWWPLLGLCAAISATGLLAQSGPEHAHLVTWSVSLMFFAFGAGFVLATIRDATLRGTALVLLGIVVVLFHGSSFSGVVFGLYMPTIIHVFLFTAAFVLYGALRQKSLTAYASLAVFAACAGVALFVDPGPLGYSASDYARDAYTDFSLLHANLVQHTGLAGGVSTVAPPNAPLFPFAELEQIYSEPVALQVGRFIAFAYTYHYFNWFSKTSIIRWHEVSRSRIAVIVVLWVASLLLYAADYGVGLRWLLFLSLLHVLLEFPLDHKTFVGIGRELYGRVARRT